METSSPVEVEPHLVQFYESDEFLAGAVAQFVGEGAVGEEPTLLVLTSEHRQPFMERLKDVGVDPAKALAKGLLVMLDAHECLRSFMTGQLPDAVLFDRHVGGTLRQLQARYPGRRVRAFGEMVDLLWRDGRHAAAVRLEELWTELQHRQPFSLLCAYLLDDFLEERSRQTLCDLHTRVVEPPQQIEEEMRNALRQGELAEVALRVSEQRLRDVIDAVPALVSYVDRDHRYRFANRTYACWFGLEPASIVGRHVRDLLGEDVYAIVHPWLDDALAGQHVRFTAYSRFRYGPPREIEAIYTPHRAVDGKVIGVIAMAHDISETARLREVAAKAAKETERLFKITAAIADAVTPGEVYAALVNPVAEALGASSGGLWVLGDDCKAHLEHSRGLPERTTTAFNDVPLDAPLSFPALDALRTGELLWFETRAALLARYPHLVSDVTLSQKLQVGCVPLRVCGEPQAVLAFVFEDGGTLDHKARPFLEVVARYGSQALERLKLLAREERDRAQAELLFALAQTVIRAENLADVFNATLDTMEQAVGTRRGAILIYDDDGVLRFKAWRGLSDEYRRAAEGHTPWPRDAVDAQAVWVSDAAAEPSLAACGDLLARERIGALGFIPLVAGGKLLGKFVLYYDRPRVLARHELDLVRAIANHIAAATVRYQALDALQQTVRFNEMFTAILGHDLRNPLGAIMTAAQLLLKRADNEKLSKPLARITSSGGRMARMIDQLLDFTRVRVGAGIPLTPRHIDLKQVVELVVEELDAPNPDTEIALEVKGDTTGRWDADRLAQVFSNLVGNAVQHGPPASRVTVCLDGTASQGLRVTVHNHGVVPPERLKRLFEPMMGADHRGESAEGLGLGLFISQEIVRAHDGAITVESSECAGTSFHVTLPRVLP